MLGLVISVLLAYATEEMDQSVAPQTAGPAGAQATPGDDIVVKGDRPKERRRICRNETATGTSFSKRVCRSVAEIEEQRAQSVKLMDEVGRIQTLQQTTDKSNLPK